MTGTAVNRNNPPAPNVLEVSILGPGFGETVLLHLGAGRWVIVDSCIDRSSGRPAALSYLHSIGVTSSAVELVVATHWHDDHIRGFSSIVSECCQAQVCCSSVLNSHELMAIANLYAELPIRLKAGPTELQQAFEVIIERRGGPGYKPLRWLRSDMEVLAGSIQICGREVPLRMRALSPAVLSSLGCPRESSETFKVSHHGSISGHADSVWNKLLRPNPMALLTPFRWGRHRLPSVEDRRRIRNLSTEAYITAHPDKDEGRKRGQGSHSARLLGAEPWDVSGTAEMVSPVVQVASGRDSSADGAEVFGRHGRGLACDPDPAVFGAVQWR
jgi:hypothetical protein